MSAEAFLPKDDWTTKSSSAMEILRLADREDLKMIIKMFEREYAAFGYDQQDVWRYLDQFEIFPRNNKQQ